MKPFEVQDRCLGQLLSLEHYRLLIPAYQRPYEWRETDVALLLKDVGSTLKAVAPENYLLLGSVLLRSKQSERSKSLKECEVVDGQQRLSTIMLLYSALFQRGQELGMQLESLSERFIQENMRCLEVHHALGGATEEDLIQVERSWKELTCFSSAKVQTDDIARRKDRYSMRWKNIYEWVIRKYKSVNSVKELVTHLDKQVFVSVTIIYDLRLALRCFVNCNTTGMQGYRPELASWTIHVCVAIAVVPGECNIA